MTTPPSLDRLVTLLNDALARELQVSVQYMIQHGMGAAWAPDRRDKSPVGAQARFVATKWPYF